MLHKGLATALWLQLPSPFVGMVGELSASHTSASSVRKAPASLLPPAVSMASAGCFRAGSHPCRAGQQEGMLGVCEGCRWGKLASPDWQPCPAACMQNMVPKSSHRPEGGRAQPGVRDANTSYRFRLRAQEQEGTFLQQ